METSLRHPSGLLQLLDGAPLWLLLLVAAALLTGGVALFVALKRDPLSHLPLPRFEGGRIPWLTDDTRLFLSGKLPAISAARFDRNAGKPFVTKMLGGKFVNVYTYEHVRKVLAMEHDAVEGAFPPGTERLLGYQSLSSTHGHAHLRLRKMVNPPFTAKALERILPRLQEIAEKHTARWAGTGVVNAVDAVKVLTYEVMVSVMLGFDEWLADGRLERSAHLFYVWLDGLFVPDMYLPGTPFRKAVVARRELAEMIEHTINSRAARKEAAAPNLLDSIIDATDEQGQQISMEGIVDMCINTLFAGHDTSASTLVYTLWMLEARHPEVMEKLRAEQAEVMAAHGPAMTPAALKAMRYTAAIVNEILRYQPIVPAVPRVAQRSFNLDGWRIPKGYAINVHIGYTTHDASCADTGDKFAVSRFNPDRWLADGATRAAAFMPFGGGPRMCIGYSLALQEMKVILAVLARGYEVHLPADSANIQWSSFPILRPAGNKLDLHLKPAPMAVKQ